MQLRRNSRSVWDFGLIRVRRIGIGLAALACCLLVAGGSRAETLSEADLKAKIEVATKDLKDVSMTANVVEVNKKAMEKMDQNFTRMLELKSSKVSLKLPDKVRVEGKLGMVRFEYIINGTCKISRAPAIRLKQKNDYAGDPAKLQGPFDMGIVTTSLWQYRKVRVIDDAEASAAGEIKLELRWPKGDMVYYAWLDAKNLWLKRVEKRDGAGKLQVKSVYSNAKNIGSTVWMPTSLEMFTPEGAKVGKTELVDIKYNTGLDDKLFE